MAHTCLQLPSLPQLQQRWAGLQQHAPLPPVLPRPAWLTSADSRWAAAGYSPLKGQQACAKCPLMNEDSDRQADMASVGVRHVLMWGWHHQLMVIHIQLLHCGPDTLLDQHILGNVPVCEGVCVSALLIVYTYRQRWMLPCTTEQQIEPDASKQSRGSKNSACRLHSC